MYVCTWTMYVCYVPSIENNLIFFFTSVCFSSRRCLQQKEAPSKSNDLYYIPASRIRTSFWKITLSRRVFSWGAGDESQFAGSQSTGEYNYIESFFYSHLFFDTQKTKINSPIQNKMCHVDKKRTSILYFLLHILLNIDFHFLKCNPCGSHYPCYMCPLGPLYT